ncbi:MAG: IS1182 family transposase [Pseudomonadales bacterium]
MRRFVEGEDRSQAFLFPERLDDYIAEDNPVRLVEAFVDELDLKALGFKGVEARATGRPAYHPSTLLKIYVYGYLNRVGSSRLLERECQRNVEMMWLTHRLAPDHKTIAEFRKNNGQALGGVCREFVELCRRLGLFTQALVAIDGSKFKAVNHRDKNFTKKKMKTRQERAERHIARYLAELDDADRSGRPIPEAKTQHLKDKVKALQEEMARLKAWDEQLQAQQDGQLLLTDPDARSMKSNGRGSGTVGYNVQTAVEPENHLIVAHEVTNVGSDRAQLFPMAQKARKAMQVKDIAAVADRGYFSSNELLDCERVGITTYVPKSYTSDYKKKGLFSRDDFVYEPEHDRYRCPAGEHLEWRFKTVEDGLKLHVYWASVPVCRACPSKATCTASHQTRRIKRWEHEELIDTIQARLDENPEMMQIRRQTVVHPFGTLKAWMGATHFLTKRLPRVRAEMNLHVLAYNMKRVINLLGVSALVEAVRTA